MRDYFFFWVAAFVFSSHHDTAMVRPAMVRPAMVRSAMVRSAMVRAAKFR